MSGAERILARLRQGPATAGELYGLHCIVHSRIAELRKQGHVIVCTHTPGQAGSGAYLYRLVDGSLTERVPVASSRVTRSVSDSLVNGSLRERDVDGAEVPQTQSLSGETALQMTTGRSSRSLSDSLTDRGRGATAATAGSSDDPALGDGEDEFSSGAPQSSGPEPQPLAVRPRELQFGEQPRPSGPEQLCLIEAA